MSGYVTHLDMVASHETATQPAGPVRQSLTSKPNTRLPAALTKFRLGW